MAQILHRSGRDVLQRLNQTLLQIDPYILPPYPNLSIVSGPLDPPLLRLTLSQLLYQQVELYPTNEAVIIPWTSARWTYQKLWDESSLLARALLKYRVRPRDRVGIMSGNCERYIALFFACVRVGAICVTLNNTYTATETEYALKHTKCQMLFTSPMIARFDNGPLLERLHEEDLHLSLPDLKAVCLVRGNDGFIGYEEFIQEAQSIPDHILNILDCMISPYDVANLQFTSGSTGNPKAAMLTHHPVPRWLMERMVQDLGMTDFTSSYGLTEASPTVFNAHTTDSLHARLTTVGTVLPHARVKIVDHQDRVVPIGVRGELCVTGYQVCHGYWENAEKTAELLVRDKQGELWLHTGDEAVLDVGGYCTITGRFKDIIIRGGENIYPLEIEERLVQHPSIARAIVVGVSHPRYVEVPAAFLLREEGTDKLSLDEVRSWVRKVLGRHKAPMHLFWLGENYSDEVPLTGSGKIKKFVLRDVAEGLLKNR
ncbi:short-chain-fatty-acid-CoA ligase [Pyrenophora tritici-repentis Pt-1C-BFP]|uniref:Short-chain-fatty-acid-CoA ligase n=1 Tax=Pyrenophora tritici-repentis (strain Pt-1C-BFP) TaxID=426418 RepID=B2WP41_PYRTR|nr:short-chain-fatty-acid-CoA ligase [Pyrenophora tritici-repentis Pt-1C-BFP]EDU44801.1 short-chain-fatty-acid-CoA ligase [Pyrenophora tritici-repentis Pt-1C-BFP]